ncbi:unnamed protein product [Angiostrongylus costaricensis]|uniref:Reverse transcriptase domain-containing protein n=1 Tax=Angiostrongylus costaricensis TaxID=334426 RepID=A0A0R3Q1B8_ANGCS|nr:unnamed protein product [Angiostrongylus costaricensis]
MKISPIYNDINIDVKRAVRQGDITSPKLFTATLQNVMRPLEWDNMGVEIGGRQLRHLRFADDIVLITPNVSQTERREINMINDLAPEFGRRERTAWGAFKSIEDVVKRTKNTRPRGHLFDSKVLPALTYASGTWSLREHAEGSLSVIECAVERTMLGVPCLTQVKDGI